MKGKKRILTLLSSTLLLTSCSSSSTSFVKDPSLRYLDKPEKIEMYYVPLRASYHVEYTKKEEETIFSFVENVGFKIGENKGEGYYSEDSSYYIYLYFYYDEEPFGLFFNIHNYCYVFFDHETYYSEENFVLSDIAGYCFNHGTRVKHNH